jgi:Tol biopolymer transport system component/tRNA A-37 threonylcarbamoyl transferase component Bud32
MSSAPRAGLGQLGEYSLLEKLGEGGMGTVYKALHTELDRLVAVKVIRTSQFEGGWLESRFRREIKAAGRLDHPNIVRAYDARTMADTHFLVMEYVDGLDLNELVRRSGPLGIADACEIARQAALGLQCAHEHGLVHRDIKPSNLMLNRQGHVKILDLGLARLHTATGLAMGTPDYMSPEQASDSHAVDIRTDIYSLGCTLYMLLTGSEPFGGPEYRSLLAKMTAHRDQTPRPVHDSRGDVPEGLSAVLDRMLAKSPECRFATPAQVAEALSRFSQGSDLAGLLADAEGRPVGNTLRGVPPVAVDAATPPHGTPRRAFRTGWSVAVGMMLLVLAAGIVWFRAGWVARPERSDGRGKALSESATPVTQGLPLAATHRMPPSEWIVLSWTRPRLGKPSLWLFRPDGSKRVNITNDPRYFDIHPKFSPDCRRIAFIRGESLTEPNGVYVCNANGSELRPLVTPRDKSERFASPVWISPTRICYARDPKRDREPDMEVWQVDLDGSNPRKVFRFQDAVGKGGGLVTDVSPDGRRLAIIAQQGGSHVSADVYVTDLEGKGLQTVWVDKPDEWRDARALWSPDGSRIAWHHNFTRGMLKTPIYHGVGIARLDADGKWTARLQPTPEAFVTPLAWSPREGLLLCARMHDSTSKMPAATLYLMDEQFRTVRTLFELESTPWQPGQRELGRLADWGLVPDDVAVVTER